MFSILVLSFALAIDLIVSQSDPSSPCHVNKKNEVWCQGLNQSYFDNDFKAFLDKLTNVTAIHVRNGTVKYIHANAFRSCNNTPSRQMMSLTKLDLSGNNIMAIDGKAFHCMKKLRILNISFNLWDVRNATHTGVFNNLEHLSQLDMTNSLNTMYDSGKLHVPKLSKILQNSKFESLQVLRLGSNKLEFIADFYQETLCKMPALTTVILSDNLLSTINVNTNKSCHYRMGKLDLTHNNFNYLPPSSLASLNSLQSSSKDLALYIHDQQWICDCNIVPLHNWLKSTKIQVVKKDELRCYDGHNFNKHILGLKQEEMVCVKPEPDSSIQAGVVVLIVLMVIIVAAVIAGVFIYRGKIQACARSMYDPISKGRNNDSVQYSSVESTPIA